jgi:hypothetical protein
MQFCPTKNCIDPFFKHSSKSLNKIKSLYRVIHKSVKHFKNSQQIDNATDHCNSYAVRERNSPSFFKNISQMLNVSTFGNIADIYTIVLLVYSLVCSRLLNAILANAVS